MFCMKTAIFTLFAILGFAAFCTAENITPEINAENALCFKIFENCENKGGENFVLYPKGVCEILKISLLSSSGEAQAEFEKILGVKKSELIENLKSGKFASENSEEFCEANLFLASNNFKKNENFSDILKKYFGAEVMACDFSQAQKTVDIVNAWTRENTRSMISEAFAPSDISSLTSLIIANVAVFDAKWRTKFKNTFKRKFKTPKGFVDVDMMYVHSDEKYAEVEDFKAVKLSYDGGRHFFVAVLPLDKNSMAFPSAEQFASLWNSFKDVEIRLYLPKFAFGMKNFDLTKTLKNLGADRAFKFDEENFSEFFDVKIPQRVDKFFQKTFIKVDEEGTKASSVTLVMNAPFSAPPEIKTFRANRPFSFFITDKNGKIIFMGRVGNPAKMSL